MNIEIDLLKSHCYPEPYIICSTFDVANFKEPRNLARESFKKKLKVR